jgi:3-isopropylmalate dehydrogenase
MMLRYSLNLPHEADAVESAVKAALDAGCRTRDLGGVASTSDVGDAIVQQLVSILKQ